MYSARWGMLQQWLGSIARLPVFLIFEHFVCCVLLQRSANAVKLAGGASNVYKVPS